MPAHTVKEALDRFTLIGGAGKESDNTACAMTLLAWVNGDPWTDHPPCAHPLIAQQVIAANDRPDTTPDQRAGLVRAGEGGVLDTWWVPTEVVVWAMRSERDQPTPGQYARTMTMLRRITEWKQTKERPNLRGVDLTYANLRDVDLRDANLGGADLRDADLRAAYLTGANLGGANLTGANLRGANLTGAYLRGANLTGAKYDQLTLWPDEKVGT